MWQAIRVSSPDPIEIAEPPCAQPRENKSRPRTKQVISALREYGSIAIVRDAARLKPVCWMGSSRRELCRFPEAVTTALGHALWVAQCGEKHSSAKPLHGFGGASVLELSSDFDDATYRLVYTVRFPDAVYVLHAFQKKSTRGILTPRRHLALLLERLRQAERIHAQTNE